MFWLVAGILLLGLCLLLISGAIFEHCQKTREFEALVLTWLQNVELVPHEGEEQ